MGKNVLIALFVGLILLLLVGLAFAHEETRLHEDSEEYDFMDEMHDFMIQYFEKQEDTEYYGCMRN